MTLGYAGIALAVVHDWKLGRPDQAMLGGALVFGAAVTYAGYYSAAATTSGGSG